MARLNLLARCYVRFLKYQNTALQTLACSGMKWRGFSDVPIHPKHLFDQLRRDVYADYVKPGATVLDLGCGTGTDCIAAAGRNASRVVGVEKDLGNYSLAIQRAKRAGMPVSFVNGDLEDGRLPFDDGVFDLVFFVNVLEHLSNRANVLREVQRVKKREGLALIAIPNSDTRWKRRQRAAGVDSRDDIDHKVEYSKAELEREIHAAGLVITSPLQPVAPSYPWHGLIALSAVFSPSLYRRLQGKKRAWLARHPDETAVWLVEVI